MKNIMKSKVDIHQPESLEKCIKVVNEVNENFEKTRKQSFKARNRVSQSKLGHVEALKSQTQNI